MSYQQNSHNHSKLELIKLKDLKSCVFNLMLSVPVLGGPALHVWDIYMLQYTPIQMNGSLSDLMAGRESWAQHMIRSHVHSVNQTHNSNTGDLFRKNFCNFLLNYTSRFHACLPQAVNVNFIVFLFWLARPVIGVLFLMMCVHDCRVCNFWGSTAGRTVFVWLMYCIKWFIKIWKEFSCWKANLSH